MLGDVLSSALRLNGSEESPLKSSSEEAEEIASGESRTWSAAPISVLNPASQQLQRKEIESPGAYPTSLRKPSRPFARGPILDVILG